MPESLGYDPLNPNPPYPIDLSDGSPMPYPPQPPHVLNASRGEWNDWLWRMDVWRTGWNTFVKPEDDPPNVESAPACEPVEPPYQVSVWYDWKHDHDAFFRSFDVCQRYVRWLGILLDGKVKTVAVTIWDNPNQQWLDPSGKPMDPTKELRCPVEIKVHTTNVLL
jgi:hypothetical protein